MQRIGADDLEMQGAAIVGQQTERTAIGVCDLHGRNNDFIEQQIEIMLAGQRRADIV